MQGSRRVVLSVLFIVTVPALAKGQQTIHDMLLEMPPQDELSITVNVMTPRMDVAALLAGSDMAVEGVIQSAKAGVSHDETRIETTYGLRVEEMIFTHTTTSTVPTPTVSTITIRHVGGTMMVDGRTVHTFDPAVPPFAIGTRLILFLVREPPESAIYSIMGGPYATFGIVDGKVRPFTVDEQIRQEYEGLKSSNSLP